MGSCCGGCCSSSSGLISQQIGSAYYNVRIVAENITALLSLQAALEADANVIDLLRGSTAAIAGGEITADSDNSYIAVTPEGGAATDDIITITGADDGRVVMIRPSDPAQTITLKPITTVPITAMDIVENTLTVAGHGTVTGQQVNLTGALPSGLEEATYWVIAVDLNTIKVATSKANALADIPVDLTNAGTGDLEVGNITLTGDAVLTGTDTIMLVRDGLTYRVLTTTGVPPAVDTAIDNLQPLDPVLTALANLIMAGQAGKLLQVDAEADGFQFFDITAELAGKANTAHTHAIADTDGLQAALDGKAAAAHSHNDLYYTEAETDSLLGNKSDTTHDHDAVYQKKATISTAGPSGGAAGDIWFKVA